MKSFEEIQRDIKYDESIAGLRRLYQVSVIRLINRRLNTPNEMAKLLEFEKGLDNLLQK